MKRILLVVTAVALLASWPSQSGRAAIAATAAERRCGNTTDNVQLTFDDVADVGRVSAILDVLRDRQVRAGFFVTGQWARSHPGPMARIRTEGHWVGNHSATHANLPRLSWSQIAAEIDGGVRSALFRPPYGAADGRVREAAAAAGYRLCFWDIDTLDWRRRTPEEMQEIVYRELRPGAVVLAHLHGRHTLAALPGLIDGIRARGFALDPLRRFVDATIDGAGAVALLERDGGIVTGGGTSAVPPSVAGDHAVAFTRRRGTLPGYWISTASGAVHAVGGAPYLGGSQGLNAPIVAVVSTPSGGGYWTVASDGGVFAHGDAGFFGSTGGMRLNQPVVGMAPSSTGAGYWLLGRDGGVFAFGDAAFLGSAHAPGGATFVDVTARPQGDGYWLLRSDGAVAAFGRAPRPGGYDAGALGGSRTFLAIVEDGDGLGYRLVSDRGEAYHYR